MLLAITLLAFAPTPFAQESDACNHVIRNVYDFRFAPGERWSYRTRPKEQSSTLIITTIDDVPGIGYVVQIAVDHTFLGIQRFAIRRDALDASALEKLEIVDLVIDGPSYVKWHMNCLGLTFGTTVADTITSLEAQYCSD